MDRDPRHLAAGNFDTQLKNPSSASFPIAVNPSDHKHKRKISDPSRLDPNVVRSPRSNRTSSLQDVRASLLPPLAENPSTTAGRRKSTSDITSLEVSENTTRSHTRSSTPRNNVEGFVSEPKMFKKTSSSVTASQWNLEESQDERNRRASSLIAQSRLAATSATSTEAIDVKKQKVNLKPAITLEDRDTMPGSWPRDLKDDMTAVTSAQEENQSDSVPRIICDGGDGTQRPRRTHSNEIMQGKSAASIASEGIVERASSVGRTQRPSSVSGNLFGLSDPNSPGQVLTTKYSTANTITGQERIFGLRI